MSCLFACRASDPSAVALRAYHPAAAIKRRSVRSAPRLQPHSTPDLGIRTRLLGIRYLNTVRLAETRSLACVQQPEVFVRLLAPYENGAATY